MEQVSHRTSILPCGCGSFVCEGYLPRGGGERSENEI